MVQITFILVAFVGFLFLLRLRKCIEEEGNLSKAFGIAIVTWILEIPHFFKGLKNIGNGIIEGIKSMKKEVK